MLEEMVCGGQSGVDLAAAQAAYEIGIPQGGFCPIGRLNENGRIPAKFNFTEVNLKPPYIEQQNLDKRTVENITYSVTYSDGTLIIVPFLEDLKDIKDGTRLTHREVKKQKKPLFCIALEDSKEKNRDKIMAWLKEQAIHKLNVAGSRESTCPGIYEKV